jgi:type I restriction enzyme S subunit
MNNEISPVKLEQVLDFKNGKIPPEGDGEIPIYGGNGILGYTDQSNYENVLIIGRVGAYCGSVHIEKNKCWVSDNAIAGVHRYTESNEYNYYLLKCISLNKLQIGSSQPLLTQGILNNTIVNIYNDLSTQQKIAAVLSALDAKIELNQRINAELESMAKTLYDYWFVQFDFPNEKGKPYKSAGGKMVWNEELGKEIPQGWDVKPLGKALKTNLGGTPSTKNAEYWENATIPWLNSGDLSNFPIISSSSFVTRKGIENSATTILPKGSVVISLVRYIRPSIIALEACANQSVVGILETDKLKNTFIYPYLVNEVPRLMALRTGAQQPHINKETIDETLLCIPPANILGQYYKISEPIYKKIINLAFESQTLTELRGWLLPLLMNGQVKV